MSQDPASATPIADPPSPSHGGGPASEQAPPPSHLATLVREAYFETLEAWAGDDQPGWAAVEALRDRVLAALEEAEPLVGFATRHDVLGIDQAFWLDDDEDGDALTLAREAAEREGLHIVALHARELPEVGS